MEHNGTGRFSVSRTILRSALGAALASALSLGSCDAIGWGVAALAPPQKIKPLYKLPEGKKVLVFADDPTSPVNYPPVKRELANAIGRHLTEHKLVAATIPYDRVLDLMASEPKFQELGVANIGRKLGADLVLYVDIKSFRLREEGSPVWDGQLAVSVRVVDAWAAEKGTARLWPKDESEMAMPPVGMPTKEEPNSEYGAELTRDLAERMADRIAKLFYEHEVPVTEMGEK